MRHPRPLVGVNGVLAHRRGREEGRGRQGELQVGLPRPGAALFAPDSRPRAVSATLAFAAIAHPFQTPPQHPPLAK